MNFKCLWYFLLVFQCYPWWIKLYQKINHCFGIEIGVIQNGHTNDFHVLIHYIYCVYCSVCLICFTTISLWCCCLVFLNTVCICFFITCSDPVPDTAAFRFLRRSFLGGNSDLEKKCEIIRCMVYNQCFWKSLPAPLRHWVFDQRHWKRCKKSENLSVSGGKPLKIWMSVAVRHRAPKCFKNTVYNNLT